MLLPYFELAALPPLPCDDSADEADAASAATRAPGLESVDLKCAAADMSECVMVGARGSVRVSLSLSVSSGVS